MGKVRSFDFEPGTVLAGKYQVIQSLGAGWEGEVYKVVERRTGIVRAAKLFFQQRNRGNRALRYTARKLHKLRNCPILIHYHTVERVECDGQAVTMLVSDFVEGVLLSEFLRRFPGNRLSPFAGVHLLYALARGVEPIHQLGEYHGDLHSDNVIVSRFGLGFELRLIDLFRLEGSAADSRRHDIRDIVYLFWEALGGARSYARHPQVVKDICRGLKRGLILDKFPTMTHLRRHLENLDWLG